MTQTSFTDELLAAIPEAEPVVTEHLADNDGVLLLHVLMSDLERMTVGTFGEGNVELTRCLLGFIDRSLRDGDAEVTNTVAVSFVENYGALPGETDALLELWPPALRQVLGR